MLSRLIRMMALGVVVCALISCGTTRAVTPTSLPAASSPKDVSTPTPSAVVVYSQPQDADGGLILSSWREPSGSDTDHWVWENFGFENPQTISEVRWRGAYDPSLRGSGGPVVNFTVDFYTSIPANSEPWLGAAPMAHYKLGNNAGETPAAVVNGVQTYEYRFVLPAPYPFDAATTYWIQIEAFQLGDPDWALCAGSGTLGDGRHFRASGNRRAGYYNQLVLDDVSLDFVAPVIGGQVPVPEIVASLDEIAEMMANLPPAEQVPVNAEGIQEVMLVVSRSGYTPMHFAVKAGIPVRLTFRQLGYVPGGNELYVRWGPEKNTYIQLASLADTRVIEFTPPEPGEFEYSCPHDWYWGVMTVQP
jgi:hypothetical protein